MNVTVLATEFPSSAWRQAFARALIRLRPDLNPDAADELSDSAYLHLANLEPADAARLYGQVAEAPAGCSRDEPDGLGTDPSPPGDADASIARVAARGSLSLGT